MCGIAGIFGPDAASPRDPAVLAAMDRAIHHRGPDAGDIWRDEAAGVAFIHRRLAILDLTPRRRPADALACGRFVITYNGEIYNYLDLRRELEEEGKAPAWRGHSDTEVLLAGVVAWGLAETLKRATGMFAIALWDREKRTLTLARDRFGEKPAACRPVRRRDRLRLGDQGTEGPSGLARPGRPAGHRPVSAPWLHPRAAHRLRGCREDRAGRLRRAFPPAA